MAIILGIEPGEHGLSVVTVAHGPDRQLRVSVPANMATHPDLASLLDVVIAQQDSLIDIRDRGMPQ